MLVIIPLQNTPVLIGGANMHAGSLGNGRSSSGFGSANPQAARLEPVREALQGVESAAAASSSHSQRAQPALSQVGSLVPVKIQPAMIVMLLG